MAVHEHIIHTGDDRVWLRDRRVPIEPKRRYWIRLMIDVIARYALSASLGETATWLTDDPHDPDVLESEVRQDRTVAVVILGKGCEVAAAFSFMPGWSGGPDDPGPVIRQLAWTSAAAAEDEEKIEDLDIPIPIVNRLKNANIHTAGKFRATPRMQLLLNNELSDEDLDLVEQKLAEPGLRE